MRSLLLHPSRLQGELWTVLQERARKRRFPGKNS